MVEYNTHQTDNQNGFLRASYEPGTGGVVTVLVEFGDCKFHYLLNSSISFIYDTDVEPFAFLQNF